MRVADLPLPPPGEIAAVVPGARDGAASLTPALTPARAAGRRVAVVPGEPLGAGALSVASNLAAAAPLPTGAERDAWLRPVSELATRLERRYRDLGHGERYLVGVARARLAPVDLLVLDRPASRLAGPRVPPLVAALAADGAGVIWLERRLNLVAGVAADAWLLDDGALTGPLPAAGLASDPRARRLAFRSRPAPSP